MEHMTKHKSGMSTVTLFIALLNAILVVFLAQMTVDVRHQLDSVRAQLTKIEGLSQHVQQVRGPGEYLAEQCGTCHTERRYLGEYSVAHVETLIDQMDALPDAHISVQDRDKIRGALMMMKCERCHTDEVFGRLATLNYREHSTTVLRMWEHADTELSRQEVMEILRAFEQIREF